MRRVLAPHLDSPDRGRVWLRWLGTLSLLRPLGRVSRGNALEMLRDGDAAFDAMWAAISAARRSVLLNTYALAPDTVGERTLEELSAAARRGCDVLLLYDPFGSSDLRERHLTELRAAGARVLAFDPVFSLRSPFLRLVRDHRKILVVDDQVAFCGGMNVGRDYAGERYGTSRFRDVHVRVEGPGARDLGRLVAASLEASGRARAAREEAGAEAAAAGGAPQGLEGALVQVLESNVRRNTRAIQKALRYTILRAVRTCFLTSPYFVPPGRLVRDLQRAARRGLDVRVLTAGLSDVPLVRLASRHLYGRLLRSGVRIYEMRDRTLHAKTVTVDGVYGSVGSFNLDHWSYRRNLEVAVNVLDADFARQLEDRFREDLELSREVRLADWTRRPAPVRLVQWLAYQVLRW